MMRAQGRAAACCSGPAGGSCSNSGISVAFVPFANVRLQLLTVADADTQNGISPSSFADWQSPLHEGNGGPPKSPTVFGTERRHARAVLAPTDAAASGPDPARTLWQPWQLEQAGFTQWGILI
jgi:hypothetical protein